MLGRYSSRYGVCLHGENPPTFRTEYCNGSLVDMVVYCVAVAVGLFGTPDRVLANASKLSNGVDYTGNAIMIYDDLDVIIMHSKVTNSTVFSEIQRERENLSIDSISRMENVFLKRSDGHRIQLGLPLKMVLKLSCWIFAII